MASAPAAPRKASQAGLARILGVSRQAINELVKRGVLTPDERGLIDEDAARYAILMSVRPGSKTSASLQPAAVTAPASASTTPPAASAAQPAAREPDVAMSYHVAKTLREAAEARLAQLKLAEAEKRLTDAEAVGREIWTAYRTLRDTLMPLGRRVAGRLVAMTDPREIQLTIEDEVRQHLHTFRDRMLAPIAHQHAPASQHQPPTEDSHATG